MGRDAWEPWHYGYTRNAGTRSVGFGPGEGEPAIPDFVPEQFTPAIARAAQRWNISAALISARAYVAKILGPARQGRRTGRRRARGEARRIAQVRDCGDGKIVTITAFRDREGAENSIAMAAAWIRDDLSDVEIERVDAFVGETKVSRAIAEMLEPSHA